MALPLGTSWSFPLVGLGCGRWSDRCGVQGSIGFRATSTGFHTRLVEGSLEYIILRELIEFREFFAWPWLLLTVRCIFQRRNHL